MLQDLLTTPLSPWQDGSGEDRDIVIDSRIRLVRNLKQYVFPTKASEGELAAVLKEGVQAKGLVDTLGRGHYEYVALDDLMPNQRELLVVKHFSTAHHIENPKYRGVLVRDDGAVSVMINEDDHFCIHAAAAGNNLQKAWSDAAAVDDALEGKLNFAFRDDFGYLTASPSMTGTGLIAGVTLHLPGLVQAKRLNRIIQGTTKLGFVVSGIYGERNECVGNLFQISNQITLGVSENDVLAQLEKLVGQIVQEERSCRAALVEKEENAVKDRLLRSFGSLSYAWLMDQKEAVEYMSRLRLAIDLGMVRERPAVYEAMLTAIEPAYLAMKAGRDLNDEDEKRYRASAIGTMLSAYAV